MPWRAILAAVRRRASASTRSSRRAAGDVVRLYPRAPRDPGQLVHDARQLDRSCSTFVDMTFALVPCSSSALHAGRARPRSTPSRGSGRSTTPGRLEDGADPPACTDRARGRRRRRRTAPAPLLGEAARTRRPGVRRPRPARRATCAPSSSGSSPTGRSASRRSGSSSARSGSTRASATCCSCRPDQPRRRSCRRRPGGIGTEQALLVYAFRGAARALDAARVQRRDAPHAHGRQRRSSASWRSS